MIKNILAGSSDEVAGLQQEKVEALYRHIYKDDISLSLSQELIKKHKQHKKIKWKIKQKI